MCAGDSTTTATAIARECGILTPADYPVLGLPRDLMHLSATKSTIDSTYSSTDSLSSGDFGDSDDRPASGGSASTSPSSASQDGASRALSTPVKAVMQNGQGSNSNGATAYSSSVSHDSTSELQSNPGFNTMYERLPCTPCV